jgi:predicted anti-sigma-YlaC factor YlaD
MHCDDAARALYAGETPPELDLHLSACDECRLLSDDLAQMNGAFARARAEWVPSPGFRVALPLAPWRRLAIAASIIVLPLAGWALLSVRAQKPEIDVASLLESSTSPAPSSDRELLGSLFLEEGR